MEMVSTITTLISNVVTFAGGLLLLFGAVTLGTNLKDHNGPGISSGASTMTRRRLSPWRQYITSRIGRVRSLCLLSATMCLLLNSAEHWLRMVWM